METGESSRKVWTACVLQQHEQNKIQFRLIYLYFVLIYEILNLLFVLFEKSSAEH